MSGFEIAGVILGAIPIILDGFQKLNIFCLNCEDYERQLKRSKVSARVQALKFQHSIRQLFRGLVSEELITQYLDNLDERVWKVSTELNSALADLATRCCDSATLQVAIEEMRELFKELLPYLKVS
jgi:hypothetical protein